MNQEYDPYEKSLAHEIADKLNDTDSITLHLQFVRRYREEFLRRILNKVLSIDESKIRKSRAALYVHLISQHSSDGSSGH